MKSCWTTAHSTAICLTIFTLLITNNVQADMFHYFKLKKLLTAVAVAKALSNRKPTILPIPIPIPIPIHQNEVISLPSSVAKKIIMSGGGGGGYKQSGGKSVMFNGGNLGSSIYGVPLHGTSAYSLPNIGRFGAGNNQKKLFGLSRLANLAGFSNSNANSIKVVHMDSLTDGNNFHMDANNVIDGKLISGGINQFPLDGNNYVGRLPMAGGNQLYGNNQPIAGLYDGGIDTTLLNGYNPDMEQTFIYPQRVPDPRKRQRRRNRTRNGSYARGPEQYNSPMNHNNNRKYPPKSKSPPSSLESETTVTLEVGGKWNPPATPLRNHNNRKWSPW